MTDFVLPPGAVLKGAMPDSELPADLVSDMVEIDLPDGRTIDIGWRPEHDDRGKYYVRVYRQHWENVESEASFCSRENAILYVNVMMSG